MFLVHLSETQGELIVYNFVRRQSIHKVSFMISRYTQKLPMLK